MAKEECLVCCEMKSMEDFQKVFSKKCIHEKRMICDWCLYAFIAKGFEKMYTDEANCPEDKCGIAFDYFAVEKILKLYHDKESMDKYDRYVAHRQVEQMDEFIWCAHGCGMGQLNDGGNANNLVRCHKCHRRTCFTHKTIWHEGQTCAQYEAIRGADQAASETWIAQNCRNCPKCSSPIEKSDGCDHMTCKSRQCGYEFCWACLADFNDIRHDGNHRHKPTCKHYAEYKKK